MYDAALGRFMAVDIMAEDHSEYTPYHYTFNNPIRFIDIMGMDTTEVNSFNSPPQQLPQQTVERTDNNIVVTNQVQGFIYETTISGSKSNIKNISDKSAKVVSNSMVETGTSELNVSSTYRPPEHQASVMYDNAQKDGAAAQKKMYAKAGDKVIDTYELNTPEWNCTKAEAVGAMTETINEVGPYNVSHHSGDLNVINVIDLSVGSTDLKKMHKSFHSNPGIYKVITPIDKKAERAYHVEIKQ